MTKPFETYDFGVTRHGEIVRGFRLRNSRGTSADVIEWGATWTSFKWRGSHRSLVLGCADLASYESQGAYMGATVGRFANRIARGQFALNGGFHQLPCNLGDDHLHGGTNGFSACLWRGEPIIDQRGPGVRLCYDSPSGEEGYPGDLNVVLDYVLDEFDALHLDFKAIAHAPTIVNLTNHAYFNLAGDSTCDDHLVQIQADEVLATNADGLPTGSFIEVDGTPLDLRTPKVLSHGISSNHALMTSTCGYDHTYVLKEQGSTRGPVAFLRRPGSGVVMSVETDQPSIQLYTGQFMGGTPKGDGTSFLPRAGVCLEAQGYPDAPNHSHFPSPYLAAGELYRRRVVYGFTAE